MLALLRKGSKVHLLEIKGLFAPSPFFKKHAYCPGEDDVSTERLKWPITFGERYTVYVRTRRGRGFEFTSNVT